MARKSHGRISCTHSDSAPLGVETALNTMHQSAVNRSIEAQAFAPMLWGKTEWMDTTHKRHTSSTS